MSTTNSKLIERLLEQAQAALSLRESGTMIAMTLEEQQRLLNQYGWFDFMIGDFLIRRIQEYEPKPPRHEAIKATIKELEHGTNPPLACGLEEAHTGKVSERYEQQNHHLIHALHEMRVELIKAVCAAKEINCEIQHLLKGLLNPAENKNKVRLYVASMGPDEPIPKKEIIMTLTKPISPGYRRKLTVKSDYPLDIRGDGKFLGSEVVEGDSSAPVIESADKSGGSVWIMGDGSTGNKSVRILADGHVGDGEVGVTLDILYVVQNPDATVLTATEEAKDEPIPGTEPPIVTP